MSRSITFMALKPCKKVKSKKYDFDEYRKTEYGDISGIPKAYVIDEEYGTEVVIDIKSLVKDGISNIYLKLD